MRWIDTLLPDCRWVLAALALLAGMTGASAQVVCPLYRYSPAQVTTISERILVQPRARVFESRAGVYRTIMERVLVRPERRIIRRRAAVFRTVSERVLVRSGMSVERYLPSIRTDNRGRSRSVELRPAQTVLDTSPASYATRLRRVYVPAGRTFVRSLPARYGTRTRTIEVAPERVQIAVLPARYRLVPRQVLVTPPTLRLTVSGQNCVYGGPQYGYAQPASPYPIRWTPIE